MEKVNHILVIGNELDLTKVTREALGTSCELTHALTKVNGMEEARRLMPDLILLGYLEPRGTSFQLYKELRDGLLTKSIPLVVVDVRREEHSRKGWRRDEGMQMDADDYLVQPVDPIVLRETVERILNKVRKQPRDLVEVLGEMERIVKRVNKIEELLLR